MSLSGIGYNSTTDLYALEAEKKENTASKADKADTASTESSKTESNKIHRCPAQGRSGETPEPAHRSCT